MEIKGNFSSGGRSLAGSMSVDSYISGPPRVTASHLDISVTSGAGAAFDSSTGGLSLIVLENPEALSAQLGLSYGELFFYGGRAANSYGGSITFLDRLPKVIEGPEGILLEYSRSGTAPRAMSWVYEISSDLVTWTEFTPLSETILYNASLNVSHVRILLPQGSPLFARIRFIYFE